MKKIEEFFLLSTSLGRDKQSLKERFLSLAAPSRTRAYVAVLVLMVMVAAAACAFGGGSGAEDDPQAEPAPLSAEELAWFNEEFFNNDGYGQGGGPNIRNQFLTSSYDRPEEIDLFELFYLGAGTEDWPGDAEKAAVIAANGWDAEPDCACTKVSAAAMDAALRENMGIGLKDTEGVGLERFTYLEEYDAYYYYHGDTNYMQADFSEGYRDGKGLVYLYSSVTYGPGRRMLCLKETEGGYLFVSNAQLNEEPLPAKETADLDGYLDSLGLDQQTMGSLPNLVVRNTDYGLALRIRGYWEQLGIVAVGGDELPGNSAGGGAVFAAFDRYSQDSLREKYPDSARGGWLFTISAVPLDQVKDLDGNGMDQALYGWTGAAEQIIGTDDAYAYCCSMPTDVRFDEHDPLSQATYDLLKADIQIILENFLLDNGLTPNAHLPGLDGYVYRPEIWQLLSAAEYTLIIGPQPLVLGPQTGAFPWDCGLSEIDRSIWSSDGFDCFRIFCAEQLVLAGLRREGSGDEVDGMLTGMLTANPAFTTYRGTGVGMGEEELFAAYPELRYAESMSYDLQERLEELCAKTGVRTPAISHGYVFTAEAEDTKTIGFWFSSRAIAAISIDNGIDGRLY